MVRLNHRELLDSLRRRGITVLVQNGRLGVQPAAKLTEQDRESIRALKPSLLAHFLGARSATPNSRSPLVEPEVRAKIEAIEADARAKGWPPELLWNAGFWDSPRGLAAVLDADDQISALEPDYIEILRASRDILRFRRTNA